MLQIFFLSMTFFTACQRPQQPAVVLKSLPPKTMLNVSYGADTLQRMDVYLPANRSVDSTKTIVLLHGGGWAGGDKSDYAPAVFFLQQKLPQYAIVNLNYRLATQTSNHFPTQETDVQAALKNLAAAAVAYGISKKIVLMGASAGAHLALLQAYKYDTPVVPEAVISFFGPTDMATLYNSQSNAYYKLGLQLLIGGTPATKPEVFEQASPIYFAGNRKVPTLLLHGGLDRVVPVAQSKALKEKLQAANVPVELVIYPTEGHGWFGANLADSYNQVETFLKNLKGSK